MNDQDLRKAIIRVAHENPGEVREALLPLLKTGAGSRYPPPKEVIKFATDVANKIYKARAGMSDMLDVLGKAYMDSRGTGVGFSGDVATQFSDRLKRVRDEVDETNHAMYNVANSLEVLARDLKRAK